MILTSLTLTNFGVFRGRQSLALQPEPDRPIILIGGRNGVGKTTILEAIRLCFYGPLATEARSKEEYLAYLDSRIHRSPDSVIPPSTASIGVEFRYSDIDHVHTYRVNRFWERRSNGRIGETLSVERDGKPLDDVTKDHWQDFVRDLLPPGISQLFFFDGERIQHLADDDLHQDTLAQAIKGLLGLDIIERLQADLNIFRLRAARTSANGNGQELSTLESQLASSAERLANLQSERQACETAIAELQAKASRVQDNINAQGGAFARERDKLVQQRGSIQAQIERSEHELRDLAAGLLPFALIPGLCKVLKQQILHEEAGSRISAGKELLESARDRLIRRLVDSAFWADVPGSAQAVKSKLLDAVHEEMQSCLPAGPSANPLHAFSPTTARQVLSWIDASDIEVAPRTRSLHRDLERLGHDLDKVETKLRKIPPDEVLAPLLSEMQELHQQIGESAKRLGQITERLQTELASHAALQRKYEKLIQAISEHAAETSRLHLVPKLHQVLDEYKSALLCNRVIRLQELVTEHFSSLCRKTNAIKGVTIDPVTFRVTFVGRDGQALEKSQLSAGEKQVYAISMLWALARASGRPLPLVVDTPLGRLDTEHRALLTDRYFPHASHQVIILSTDTEVDQQYFERLQPNVARTLRLDFDNEESGTRVFPGYFWQ